MQASRSKDSLVFQGHRYQISQHISQLTHETEGLEAPPTDPTAATQPILLALSLCGLLLLQRILVPLQIV